MRAGQDLLLLQQVGIGGVHLRHEGQPLELVLEDLEVVAQGEGPVLREQLVLGGQLPPHPVRRLVESSPARQADRDDQQRRKHERQLGPEGQA